MARTETELAMLETELSVVTSRLDALESSLDRLRDQGRDDLAAVCEYVNDLAAEIESRFGELQAEALGAPPVEEEPERVQPSLSEEDAAAIGEVLALGKTASEAMQEVAAKLETLAGYPISWIGAWASDLEEAVEDAVDEATDVLLVRAAANAELDRELVRVVEVDDEFILDERLADLVYGMV